VILVSHEIPVVQVEASVQKWEYLEIHVKANRWTDSMGRSGELPWGGRFYIKTTLLNELGDQAGNWRESS